MARAAILGGGSWGTTLAKVLAEKGHNIRLWSHNAIVADQIRTEHVNREYLPGIKLPASIEVQTDHSKALADAEFVIAVVPSHAFREVLTNAAPHIPSGAILVTATKGIEVGTLERPSEIARELLPNHMLPAVLSGPSLAQEVAEGDPMAIVVACADLEIACRVQEFCNTDRFRVYTNEDILGVELAGALKNVIALAAGIAVGIGHRRNSQAALITRGLAEMSRLGIALGARASTFAGLAGLGDLVLTCNAELSRNRTVGVRLGRGEPLDEILASMRMVAEGVRTTKAARQLALASNVEMPIVEEVHHILFEGKPPEQATADLMLRVPKHEHWGSTDA